MESELASSLQHLRSQAESQAGPGASPMVVVVDKPGSGLPGAQGPQRSRSSPARPGPGQALDQPPLLVGSEERGQG